MSSFSLVNIKALREEFMMRFTTWSAGVEDVLFIHNYTRKWCQGKMWELIRDLRHFDTIGMAIFKANKKKLVIKGEVYFLFVVSCYEAKGSDANMTNLLAAALGFNISGFPYLMKYSVFKDWKKHLYETIKVV